MESIRRLFDGEIMGKIKRNTELLKIMEAYNSFMSADKQTQIPVVVRKEKSNHKSSLYIEQEVISKESLGTTLFDCEVRDKNPHNYSFQITSDRITAKSLVRLDEGNGVHRNNLPNIPLSEQEITTPHFHRYDSEGRFVAYKPDSLKKYKEKPLEIEEGFQIFCDEEKLSSIDGSPTKIEIKEDGALPLDYDNDPLAGIKF